MADIAGKSPRGGAPRTLSAVLHRGAVEIGITPDSNPDGGWAIGIPADEWRAFLLACLADLDGAALPSPDEVGRDRGKLTIQQMAATDRVRKLVEMKLARAAPGTTTFSEPYHRDDTTAWRVVADELKARSWEIEIGEPHPLYGDGFVRITKRS